MKTRQLGHLSPSSSQPQQILARHGKSFYWASKFLGADLAERAAQLYLFCRYVDDLADGDLPDRQESLEEFVLDWMASMSLLGLKLKRLLN